MCPTGKKDQDPGTVEDDPALRVRMSRLHQLRGATARDLDFLGSMLALASLAGYEGEQVTRDRDRAAVCRSAQRRQQGTEAQRENGVFHVDFQC
jgi:hypothetical protein